MNGPVPTPDYPAPCAACGYNLAGLPARAGRVACPECGLEQEAPERLLPWPRWPAMAARTCAPTLILCNLCLILLIVQAMIPLVMVALTAALSGPIVPLFVFLEMSRNRERDEGAKFILLGWLGNLLIGAAYFGLAAIWPQQWTMYDPSRAW